MRLYCTGLCGLVQETSFSGTQHTISVAVLNVSGVTQLYTIPLSPFILLSVISTSSDNTICKEQTLEGEQVCSLGPVPLNI